MKLGARVRSTEDGQIGFITEGETGGLWVRLDRRGENRLVPFREQQWKEDREPAVSPLQVARVCHAADVAWQLVHGSYSVKGWIDLRETERIAWLKGPPDGSDPRRQTLYDAVKKAAAK